MAYPLAKSPSRRSSWRRNSLGRNAQKMGARQPCARTTNMYAAAANAKVGIMSFTVDVHRPGSYACQPGGDQHALAVDGGGTKMTIPAHPGQILAGKLASVGILPTELARQLRVPANRITQIIQGKRGITGDSALRLAHWFGDAPEFWMGLQIQHELRVASQQAGKEIRSLPRHPVRSRAS